MFYTELKKEPSRYLMYLRKSRQDDPNETIEEVLAKHETRLQEYAERELGGRIPEDNIYREVVSGDSIAARIEIKKVFSRIEDPAIIGVIVADVQRLGRPELADADTIISSFRFTKTFVVTQQLTYDLENQAARRFFQDELLRGRDYLDYVKTVLSNGREAAVRRGCFIMSHAPFGYDRVKIGKNWTLKPNDNADLVRLIFEWRVKEGLTPGAITRRLNESGFRTVKNKGWQRGGVLSILQNIHYTGKVSYYNRKKTITVENGEKVVKHVKQPADKVLVCEGLHPAIIDQETYDAAQEISRNNPRLKNDTELRNVLSGILRCSKCGCAMSYARHGSPGYERPRYRCDKNARNRTYRYNNLPPCSKESKVSDVLDAVINTLENVELPALQAKIDNGDGDAAVIQKRIIDKLVKQMEDYRDREARQYEFLETGVYSPEVFNRRHAELRELMDACEKEMHQARAAMPKRVNYAEKVVSLRKAIDALKDPNMDNLSKNKLLREIIDHIDYTGIDHGIGKTEIVLDVYLRLG